MKIFEFLRTAAVAESTSSNKPQLRGLHNAVIKRNLIVCFGITTAVTVAMSVFYNSKQKEAYAEFYKSYDPKKSFERMKNAGLLQSAK